jgi:hypothetical protein
MFYEEARGSKSRARFFQVEAARGSNSYTYTLSLETPSNHPIFAHYYITIWESLPPRRCAKPLRKTSACGTPRPSGARPGRCRRIAVMRWCRDLSLACNELVARTCITDRPDSPTGGPVAPPKCATSRAGARGSHLTSKSTPLNGGRGRARSPATLFGGRDRGPGRQDSLGSYSFVGEEFAGRCGEHGRQEPVRSAVI